MGFKLDIPMNKTRNLGRLFRHIEEDGKLVDEVEKIERRLKWKHGYLLYTV